MDNAKYMKIRLNSLHPAVAVPFELFVKINNRMIHYLRAGDSLIAEKIEDFDRKAPDAFYIYEHEHEKYKEHLSHMMISDELSTSEKAVMLRESSLAIMEQLYENPDVDKALDESKEVIGEFIGFMDQDPDAMGHLIGLSSHDFYTYNHSLDVGIYSLGLGAVAGYSGEDLKELGYGALVHDVGKRHVDVEIICKDGPLNDDEWAEMLLHPQFGLMILDKHGATEAAKACCFEHHENFQGTGYPQKLSGPEIHPMARIIAITDTYDALTTKRSYNEPMTPTTALQFMNEKLKAKYDASLLSAMNDILFKMSEVQKKSN